VIPTAIRATVRDYIRAHKIFQPGPIVVAVSGGADSTALLLILADFADEFGLVIHVAHFDHRTRPKQSAMDADVVARLASRVGAPIRVGRAAKATKSEEAARVARYEFLRRAAREVGATTIATGHTRDDQAETVLLHLTRGAGLAGIAGMRPLRDGIARPLLGIGRADTVAVCRAARVRPRTDPTNRSLRFARNRVRLKVIPELARINPRVREAVARLADAAADLATNERGRVEIALRRAMRGDVIALETLDDAELRDAVLSLAWSLATGRTLDARHREALTQLTASTDGSRAIDLPGGRAIREYDRVRFSVGAMPDDPRVPEDVDRETRIEPGRELLWSGWRMSLGDAAHANGALEAIVPENLLRSLVVRRRRPGDRLAGSGSKKLQDVFTDAKIPAARREGWPVIASVEGVWWVPGVTLAPRETGGTRLAVAAPAHFENELWTSRVRQVASKEKSVAKRPQRGRSR
jgi:tRNA(Ile)-lysidine synthetase-like protein